MSRRESSRDPIGALWLFDQSSPISQNQPDTIIQAVQESAPHIEPPTSAEEKSVLHEILMDSIDALGDIEIWILNALVYEKMSLREVEYVLGIPKTTVARKRDKIFSKLREALQTNKQVTEYLNGKNTYGTKDHPENMGRCDRNNSGED